MSFFSFVVPAKAGIQSQTKPFWIPTFASMASFLFFLFFTINSFAAEQLIIEPDMGRTPVINFINNAKKSVDLVMYGFTDKELLDALKNAKNHGKNVRVLLEPEPYKAYGENDFSFRELHATNINTLSPNPDVKLTHQKTLIADQDHAMVMTFNFTHSTFSKERNFALILDDPAMTAEIIRVFNADAQQKNISVSNPDLVWSPNNSREKILEFIKNSNSEIKIYAQDISDYQTIGTLAKAARSGKSVKILLSKIKQHSQNRKMEYLQRAGVEIRYSNDYFIHAKVIIVDQNRAMLGSINLTRNSINDNRELAVITHDKKIVEQLVKTFDKDWKAEKFALPKYEWVKKIRELVKNIKSMYSLSS